jgi:hypothetical protein
MTVDVYDKNFDPNNDINYNPMKLYRKSIPLVKYMKKIK